MTNKELGAILYMYYLNNHCQSDFCFGKKTTRKQVKNVYNNLSISKKELKKIESNIDTYWLEGTDYEYIEIRHPDYDGVYVQVTSLIDYNGKRTKNYNGNAQWADVGIFWEEGKYGGFETDFEDLEDEE